MSRGIASRAVCPQCHRAFSIGRDGLLNKHRLRSGERCLGSGCDPATNLEPAKAKQPAPKARTSRVKRPAQFRMIDQVSVDLHDPVRERWDASVTEHGVRLYCTSSNGGRADGWALQVRAQVKTKAGPLGKHFAIGTASMTREDLLWLRDLIDAELQGTS